MTCKVDEINKTSLRSDQRKHNTYRRLCSNSQGHKRRQLVHGARNRAAQLITVQEPAKSTKPTISLVRPTQTHHPSSPLFQLTVAEANTAGPRCSESCRSAYCCPNSCKLSKNSTLFRPTQTHHPSSPLFQLTVAEANTAGPRCSESCRSVDSCSGALQNRPTSDHTKKPPPSLQSNHFAVRTCQTTARARCSGREARAHCRRTT
jgi:hypothetical protein